MGSPEQDPALSSSPWMLSAGRNFAPSIPAQIQARLFSPSAVMLGEDEHSQCGWAHAPGVQWGDCHLPWLGWQLWLPRGSFRVLISDSHWALISSAAFSFPVAAEQPPHKRHALMVRHLEAVLLRRLLIISSRGLGDQEQPEPPPSSRMRL